MAQKVLNQLDFDSIGEIINLKDAVMLQSPVTLSQLNKAIEGLAAKDNVRVATQGNINLASPGAAIDGITLNSVDRVLVKAQTSPAENGIYIWNGATVAMTRSGDANTSDELESAITIVDEGTDGGTSYRQTSVNFILGTGTIQWVKFGVVAPNATELVVGLTSIATQAKTDAGVDDFSYVTPLKLKNSPWAHKGAALVIGDGTATQFDLTHNFGTRDVAIAVYQAVSPYGEILLDKERPDVNTARVRFLQAPALNSYRVIVSKV